MSITVENLTYIYDKRTKYSNKALDNISCTINKGETIGIMGKTGSGKSTLINLLGHLTKPSARQNSYSRSIGGCFSVSRKSIF